MGKETHDLSCVEHKYRHLHDQNHRHLNDPVIGGREGEGRGREGERGGREGEGGERGGIKGR